MSKELDYSPHSAKLGHWNSSRQCRVLGVGEGTKQRGALCGSKAASEQISLRCRTSNWRPRKLQAQQVSGRHIWTPSSPPQEPDRRGACFGDSTFSRKKWATGDLPEECRFLLNTQLMFLKNEKDPTSKQFDYDEWIRSLTRPQEITADVPEDSVMSDQQEVDTQKKFGPFRWRSSCESMSHDDFWRSAKEKLQPSRQRCGSSELDPKVVLMALAIFH